MSTDTLDQRSGSLVGAAFAGLPLLARPGLLLAWSLVTVPAVLLGFVAVRAFGAVDQWPFVVLLTPLTGLLAGASLLVVSTAVFRTVLRPEDPRFGYLRLGRIEGRVLLKSYEYGGMPLSVQIGLAGLFFALLLTGALIYALVGPAVGKWAIPAALVVWGVATMAVSARSSLTGVAAFVGRSEPRQAGWDIGERHTAGLVVQRFLVGLIWLGVAMVLLGSWWRLHHALARPSALLSPTLPVDAAGWLGYGLEAAPLAVIISLILVVGAVLGSAASVRSWAILGGEREAARRRTVFEA